MKTVSKILAMSLIAVAAGGFAIAPAFAADAASPATDNGAQSQGATPATQAPAANANTDNSGNGNSGGAVNQDKTGDTSQPGSTNDNQAATPAPSSDTTDQTAATPQPEKTHMALSKKKVEQVQTALANSGEQVQIDGLWGPKTTEALKDFQRQHGLKATGHLNHATDEALPKLNS